MSDSVRPHRRQPTGLPISGILQPRTLEWAAISFSNAWKWKVKGNSLSHVRLFTTPWTAAHQAPPSMGFSRPKYWSGVLLPSPHTHKCTNNANQQKNCKCVYSWHGSVQKDCSWSNSFLILPFKLFYLFCFFFFPFGKMMHFLTWRSMLYIYLFIWFPSCSKLPWLPP